MSKKPNLIFDVRINNLILAKNINYKIMPNALALIIGNANYSLQKHKLINSVNDASDIAQKLSMLGFTINCVTNADKEKFERSVTSFGNNLQKYDIGLFYFSGHGLQIDGNNYLTAIDTNFIDAISAKYTSFPLNSVIEYMQQSKTKVNIIILDACRDNPLPNGFRGINDSGLAPIYAPKGTIIAFSTSPGERALDYGSGRNSIYTGSLLNHISDKNIPIEDFFKRVRTSVFNLSKGKQTSWEHTSLIGDFYFNSGDLIQSVKLPYRQECIADELFVSRGTKIDTIIEKLKIYDWYTQGPAIGELSTLDVSSVDESDLFLLGRNILQTAIGGTFAAKDIMENLSTWLLPFLRNKENHVLNGMLYEMYFDSKGHFRKGKFKSNYLDELFQLQTDVRYISSFEFIRQVLEPFTDDVFYLPHNPPTILAIEAVFEEKEFKDFFDDSVEIGAVLISVKHGNTELLQATNVRRYENDRSKFPDFEQKLRFSLGVPKGKLRLSTNLTGNEKFVTYPYSMNLSRKFSEADINANDF
ncbi:caspase family protein [Pedobacter sp. BMA]|uniref:caspase family protein n=1 Tax=Pedobacter sp. BMA TaxID=1663685 RepID=UPI001E528A96|nr:caspase family protein [Pedobacter sp. BMA]